MLRRLLLLLGDTPASHSAEQYAFRLAQATNAAIAGLAGIDLDFIGAPMLGGVGTSAYKVRRDEQLMLQAEDIRRRMHQTFRQACAQHHLEFEWLSFDGDPIETLYLATETRDLVITGHDTAFRGGIHEQLSEVLAKLLTMTPRPIIVCPDELPDGDGILFAYDGSATAMRALQIFTLLGIGKGKRVCVTSIDANQELAARRAAGAANYLRSHDYEADTIPIVSQAHPADVIKIEIADRKIGTLVMGAYGHRGFREYLFGSTTNGLLENPPCALFVYH